MKEIIEPQYQCEVCGRVYGDKGDCLEHETACKVIAVIVGTDERLHELLDGMSAPKKLELVTRLKEVLEPDIRVAVLAEQEKTKGAGA